MCDGVYLVAQEVPSRSDEIVSQDERLVDTVFGVFAPSDEPCNGVSKCLKAAVLIILFFSSVMATTPRIALEHFEKDLQVMAKSPAITVKAGSFVDRLASKRKHKEMMEQELAAAKKEVEQLKQEVEQIEAHIVELDRLAVERSSFLQQRAQDFEHLSAQLVAAREAFGCSEQRNV